MRGWRGWVAKVCCWFDMIRGMGTRKGGLIYIGPRTRGHLFYAKQRADKVQCVGWISGLSGQH